MTHFLHRILIPLLALIYQASCSEITQWNALLLERFAANSITPPHASRQLAMLHVAQFEAANTPSQTYEPYLFNSGLEAGPFADPELASAVSAYTIMSTLYPADQALWDTALAASIEGFSEEALSESVQLGTAAAAAVIANRTDDGSDDAGSGYTVPELMRDGDWRPTPPAHASYLLPNWRLVTPWAYVNIAELAASVEPPTFNSAAYLSELDEVRRLGAAENSERTEEQSLIAQLWSGGSGTVTPPGQWCQIATQVVASQEMTFMQQAHTFARLSIALADAAIVCWATKFNSQRWRPITALQLGDYPEWSSFVTTPPFPAHTSGHSTFSAAAATVLREQTGGQTQQAAFTLSVGENSREFTNLEVAASEAAWSRVYGGIHYESDSEDGLTIGNAIGLLVTQSIIAPKADLSTISLDEVITEGSLDSASNSGSVVEPSQAAVIGFTFGVVGILVLLIFYYMFFGAVRR